MHTLGVDAEQQRSQQRSVHAHRTDCAHGSRRGRDVSRLAPPFRRKPRATAARRRDSGGAHSLPGDLDEAALFLASRRRAGIGRAVGTGAGGRADRCRLRHPRRRRPADGRRVRQGRHFSEAAAVRTHPAGQRARRRRPRAHRDRQPCARQLRGLGGARPRRQRPPDDEPDGPAERAARHLGQGRQFRSAEVRRRDAPARRGRRDG